MGHVSALFVKPDSGHDMAEKIHEAVRFSRGLGIDGDISAHCFSPRQVLVTRHEDLEVFGIRAGGLRENVVVAGLQRSDLRPGGMLALGESVKIRLTFDCEPCKRILPVVRSLQEIVGYRGVLGVVVAPGVVSTGDVANGVPMQWPPFSDIPYRRFLGFVGHVPEGRVVTLKQVTIGMGVASSYARAIPAYISRTSSDSYPVHRIVAADGILLRHIDQQASKLRAEGVAIISSQPTFFDEDAPESVDLRITGWEGTSLYLD